jgi:hypothetical protein
MLKRGRAHINPNDMRFRVVVSKDSCLIGATPGNEDIQVGLVVAVGPENPVGVAGVKPLPVVHQPSREIQNGLGIHPPLVLAGHGIFEWIVGHDGWFLLLGVKTHNLQIFRYLFWKLSHNPNSIIPIRTFSQNSAYDTIMPDSGISTWFSCQFAVSESSVICANLSEAAAAIDLLTH